MVVDSIAKCKCKIVVCTFWCWGLVWFWYKRVSDILLIVVDPLSFIKSQIRNMWKSTLENDTQQQITQMYI